MEAKLLYAFRGRDCDIVTRFLVNNDALRGGKRECYTKPIPRKLKVQKERRVTSLDRGEKTRDSGLHDRGARVTCTEYKVSILVQCTKSQAWEWEELTLVQVQGSRVVGEAAAACEASGLRFWFQSLEEEDVHTQTSFVRGFKSTRTSFEAVAWAITMTPATMTRQPSPVKGPGAVSSPRAIAAAVPTGGISV